MKVVPHSKTAMLLTNKITGNVGQPINQYKEDRDSTELMRTAKEMNVLYFITKNTYFLPILSHCLHCSKKKGTLTGEKPLVKLTAKSSREFVDIHGKLLLKVIAENLNTNNLFRTFMDGSIIHKQDREVIY